MLEVIAYVILILAGIAGFNIAYYIHSHKRTKGKAMVCPMNFHCDPVINSKYSKLFGMPLENLGMLYYSIITLSYLFFLFSPIEIMTWFTQGVLYTSAFAFVFSMYLTYLQAFKLKNWCSWCLMSASLCVIIFVFALLV